MYVIGATKAEYFAEIRKIVPDNFLLVPGIGAQGGNLQEVCKYGLNDTIGLLIPTLSLSRSLPSLVGLLGCTSCTHWRRYEGRCNSRCMGDHRGSNKG